MKPSVMFAFVSERAKKGTLFLELKIDRSKANILKGMKSVDGYVKFHVYVIDSLATTIREFKTLRMSEFYGLANIIREPSKGLSNIKGGERHKNSNKMFQYLKKHG